MGSEQRAGWHERFSPEVQRVLSQSPQWWSALFEAAGTGLVIADTEGGIVFLSPAVERMLGYSAGDLVEVGVAAVSHPEDMELDAALFAELVAGERERYQIDKRYFRRDGTLMWGRLTVLTVAAPDRPDRWVVGMLEDITEERLGEQALRRFAAEAAHELRGPAAVFVGAVRMLEEGLDELPSDERRRLVRMAVEHGTHLLEVCGRILDLSRLEHGYRVDVHEARLVDLVAGTIEQLDTGDVEVVTAVEDVTVRTDPIVLVQAMRNLLTNAVTYGRGEVHVAAHSEPGAVILSVRDHGTGLSEDTVEQLFQPFTRGARGTGLGLAIVRGLVESIDGMVWYEDAAPGARFLIRLPLNSGEDASVREGASHA